MGDWLSMEMRKKQKTLIDLFFRFIVLFCINILLIFAGAVLLLMLSVNIGLTLPANRAETELAEYVTEIQAAGLSPDAWIPKGCTYGIYSADGTWLKGDFSVRDQKLAWSQYQKGDKKASAGNYYRYIVQDNQNICIVKYSLYMKYTLDRLNRILPPPEILFFVAEAVLFILNVVLLSGHFAKKLKQELGKVQGITEKIAENDLEFEAAASDIREMDEVLFSLSKMKTALKTSLTRQWSLEEQKREQLAALTHDIKTPLTIIKGNAELLAEADLSSEDKACTQYILENVNSMEQYLAHIRQVLNGQEYTQDDGWISCSDLAEQMKSAAVQVAAAEKMPATFYMEVPDGNVYCNTERLLRAWKNILSNAAEHTEKVRGIEVRFGACTVEKEPFMQVCVRDYGRGFSAKDLIYADQQFYSGDTSRHNRDHQGLGMTIAKNFLEEQGGRMVFGNHGEVGAEVVCQIKMSAVLEKSS